MTRNFWSRANPNSRFKIKLWNCAKPIWSWETIQPITTRKLEANCPKDLMLSKIYLILMLNLPIFLSDRTQQSLKPLRKLLLKVNSLRLQRNRLKNLLRIYDVTIVFFFAFLFLQVYFEICKNAILFIIWTKTIILFNNRINEKSKNRKI